MKKNLSKFLEDIPVTYAEKKNRLYKKFIVKEINLSFDIKEVFDIK